MRRAGGQLRHGFTCEADGGEGGAGPPGTEHQRGARTARDVHQLINRNGRCPIPGRAVGALLTLVAFRGQGWVSARILRRRRPNLVCGRLDPNNAPPGTTNLDTAEEE